MKKILLIAYRDFSIRIRNRTFLVSTLLLPIGVVLFYGTIFFFSSNDTDRHRIGIVDEKHWLNISLEKESNFQFVALKSNEVKETKDYGEKMNLDAVLRIPNIQDSFLNGHFQVFTYTKVGILTKNKLERIIQAKVERARFANKMIDSSVIESVQMPIQVSYQSVTGSMENDLKEGLAYGLSFIIGIMMYVILTIYGSQVMRGVMEEKTNRIVEIIISSVKPFELLMGKIIGIGMVSFLQLMVWFIFLFCINIVLSIFIGASQLSSIMTNSPTAPGMLASQMSSNPEILAAFQGVQSLNFLPIVFAFIYYFLGGYFLYSSLFAAVGSAVGDDPQDVQALMFPIMIPILLSFVFLSKSVNNPNCTEAVIASLVPFTSPVVMMSRVVFGVPEGVPLWQLILSMVILLLSSIFFIFLAARIYKVGILLYGKKVSWKEMMQWVFIK